jgi:hypothetical protein
MLVMHFNALVELHRRDEVTKACQDCLKLTPDEPTSLAELGYIKGLRAKSPSATRFHCSLAEVGHGNRLGRRRRRAGSDRCHRQ